MGKGDAESDGRGGEGGGTTTTTARAKRCALAGIPRTVTRGE